MFYKRTIWLQIRLNRLCLPLPTGQPGSVGFACIYLPHERFSVGHWCGYFMWLATCTHRGRQRTDIRKLWVWLKQSVTRWFPHSDMCRRQILGTWRHFLALELFSAGLKKILWKTSLALALVMLSLKWWFKSCFYRLYEKGCGTAVNVCGFILHSNIRFL